MKGYRFRITGALLALSMSALAVTYSSQGSTREDRVQLCTGAEFTKKWDNGLRLNIEEELRFDLYDHQSGTDAKGTVINAYPGAAFSKSYTTLSLAYHPIEYVKIDAGYTLRILGRKDLSDSNEFLRHRVFLGVTGQYTTRYAKLYVRERVLCNMRTDSINLLEKNRYNFLLRSRIGSDFLIPGKPVKPYLWVELENTLNAPAYQQKDGHQYISRVRTQAGVKWRLTKRSSLNFYYRFTYGYYRDVNVNKGYYSGKALKLRLDEETSYTHAIGVVYNFDW